MKILFWNVRGLGEKKRRGQLKELIDKNRVDILYLQETMKREVSISELRGLVGNSNFSWNWTACSGHSGGTLIGVKQGDLDAVEMDEGRFSSSMKVRDRGVISVGKSLMYMDLCRLS